MAIPATNIIPVQAYPLYKTTLIQLRLNLVGFTADLAASDATYEYLRGISRTLKRAKKQLRDLKNAPGFNQFAKEQELDPLYNTQAEYAKLRDAINATLAWMQVNISTTVTTKLPDNWDDSDLISTVYTPIDTAGLRAALNLVIAEIA